MKKIKNIREFIEKYKYYYKKFEEISCKENKENLNKFTNIVIKEFFETKLKLKVLKIITKEEVHNSFVKDKDKEVCFENVLKYVFKVSDGFECKNIYFGCKENVFNYLEEEFENYIYDKFDREYICCREYNENDLNRYIEEHYFDSYDDIQCVNIDRINFLFYNFSLTTLINIDIDLEIFKELQDIFKYEDDYDNFIGILFKEI